MAISVRKATDKDIPAILDLLYKLGRPKAKNDSETEIFEKQIKQYISNSDKQILVAELDSKIVGMASLMFISRLNRDKLELYIPELIVSEENRGKGLGNKLIEQCIKIAKEKKCHMIKLESGNQRIESHQFYKKLGFIQHALSFTLDIQ